ncbi:MAG: response regulator [Burkholderiales bacterium]|nr:response regulator [Burkholderiales bacterium]
MQHERFAQLAGVGGFVLDLDDDRLHWSDACCALHGLPAGHQPTLEEAIGYFAPEAQLQLYAAFKELRTRGGRIDLELPLLTASDARLWVRVVAEAEPSGARAQRIVGAMQDVTERRSAQEQERRSMALLHGAMDALEQPFALYDPEDRLVYFNEAFRDALALLGDTLRAGLRYEDLLHELLERQALPPEADEAWVRRQVQARRQLGRAEHSELQTLADGRVQRVIERLMPDGHVASLRIDLSELVQARRAAESAAEAKGQFVANISHEIRTPLNAVLGMLQLLARTPLDARQQDYQRKAEGAARALLAILNDTLDFSKIEAGRMELDPQPFELDALLQELDLLLRPLLGDKPVALRLERDARLPRWLLGDALRLRQVLVNLGSNAIKFTAQGEVGVRLQAIAIEPGRVQLRVEVRDTGIGISAEQQQRLFRSFTQAEAGITRRYGGTGLGLVISQRLVALMHGELELHSTEGQGSCFAFNLWLPRGAVPDSAPLDPPPRDGERLRGLRLLLVEDHPLNQQVARELLQLEGATVQVLGNGREALEHLLAGGAVDAVLMDLQMPELDGFSATRRLREAGFGLPIIAMTANASSSDRQACLAAGMNDHVGKPFDLHELVGVLLRHTPGGAPSPLAPALRRGVDPGEAAIDEAGALARLGGRADVYANLIERWLAELPAQAQALRDASDAGPLLHALKGLAGTLGALRLAAALQAAEAGGDAERASALAALQASHEPLQAMAQRLRAQAAPPPVGAAAEDGLARLRELLSHNDAAVLDALLALRPRLSHERYRELAQLVEDFDFPAALALIDSWHA